VAGWRRRGLTPVCGSGPIVAPSHAHDTTQIKRPLRPLMITRRKGTIQSAFAAAIAPHDEYDEAEAKKLLLRLGQKADALTCVYCGASADSWDHVVGTVSDGEFTGVGHRLRNLVPCCSPCNTSKRGKSWRDYLNGLRQPASIRNKRVKRIKAHIKGCEKDSNKAWRNFPEYKQLQDKRDKILKLMEEGDELAETIRKKLQAAAGKKRR
jgi:5-methylcytosine-specific restriction endonuclease McrA